MKVKVEVGELWKPPGKQSKVVTRGTIRFTSENEYCETVFKLAKWLRGLQGNVDIVIFENEKLDENSQDYNLCFFAKDEDLDKEELPF